MSPKVLVIDQHPLIQEGLAAVLESASPGREVLFATSVPAALTVLAANQDIELIILDPVPADPRDVAELIDRIRTRHQHSALVLLSASDEPEEVRVVARSGMAFFVPKHATVPELLEAVRRATSGGVTPGTGLSIGLTARHNEVLIYLCQGKTNRQIGAALMITEKTVKAHLGIIFKLLRVENRTQAAIAAERLGLGRECESARRRALAPNVTPLYVRREPRPPHHSAPPQSPPTIPGTAPASPDRRRRKRR